MGIAHNNVDFFGKNDFYLNGMKIKISFFSFIRVMFTNNCCSLWSWER
jgi:hypothetical protein